MVKGVGFMFNDCNIELIQVDDFVTGVSSKVEPATLRFVRTRVVTPAWSD